MKGVGEIVTMKFGEVSDAVAGHMIEDMSYGDILTLETAYSSV